MSDLFDDIAKDHVNDEPVFEDLPPDAWLIVETATKERGGAAAAIENRAKQDAPPNFQFRLGVTCLGGDSKITEKKHAKRMTFAEFWVHPDARYENVESVISGRFMGFLNVIFSSGVGEGMDDAERKAARWGNTLSALKAAAEEADLTVETYREIDPDPQDEGLSLRGRGLALAGAAVAALEDEPKLLMIKTRQKKFKTRDGNEVKRVQVGSFEDFTLANAKNRKVEVFAGEDASPVEATQTTF